jgi:hypothetical protein
MPVVPRDRVERLLMEEPAACRPAARQVAQRPGADVPVAPLAERDGHDAGVEVRRERRDAVLAPRANAARAAAQRDRAVHGRAERAAPEIELEQLRRVLEHQEIGVEEEHTLQVAREQLTEQERHGRLRREVPVRRDRGEQPGRHDDRGRLDDARDRGQVLVGERAWSSSNRSGREAARRSEARVTRRGSVYEASTEQTSATVAGREPCVAGVVRRGSGRGSRRGRRG